MGREPGIALKVAAAALAGVVLVYLLAFEVGVTRDADLRVASGFFGLYGDPVPTSLTRTIPHLSDPPFFAVWFLLIAGVALFRGRPRTALAVGAVLLGASVTTALLKLIVLEPRLNAGGGLGLTEWPSGHATASMSVALCAILVAAPRWRPVVAALGGLYTLAVTLTLLVAAWHFPSDVFAGYLVAGAWTAGALAALWALEARKPAATRPARRLTLVEALLPALVVGAAGVVLAGLVLLLRPAPVLDYARAHTTFVLGAAGLVALGLSLVAALSAALTATRAARVEGVPPRAVRG